MDGMTRVKARLRSDSALAGWIASAARNALPGIGLGCAGLCALAAMSLCADAQGADKIILDAGAALRAEHQRAFNLGMLGLIAFAATTAIVHVTSRNRWTRRDSAQKALIADLQSVKDRYDSFVGSEPQTIITWASSGSEPDISGDSGFLKAGLTGRRVLGFGSWLMPADAQQLETAVGRLLDRGEPFSMTVLTQSGRFAAAEGRPVTGRAVLRIRDLSHDRQDAARLKDANAGMTTELQALKTLLDEVPHAAWRRGAAGAISWANAAYARAVGAASPEEAVAQRLELLEKPAIESARAARGGGNAFRDAAGVIINGERRRIDIVEAPAGGGAVGMATDVTPIETLRQTMELEIAAHVRTLHQLPTAVAIFDRAQRLTFHNESYRTLWGLDAGFLAQRPTDGEVLDKLRDSRRLQEQADYRGWKASVLDSYRSAETQETWWHLPSSRVLRVVTSPNPQGGVTYLFDDMTERMRLESRFKTLMHVQGETLDTLSEGVAVFGSDGRLKLVNSAFKRLWGLDDRMVDGEPHIDAVINACGASSALNPVWREMRGAVTGLHDSRVPLHRRMERASGRVLDCATAPLPDGATLMTFSDVTSSVQAESMLRERNEALESASRMLNERNTALEKASQIRRNFVHTVSYELRTPLQSIAGFSEILQQGAAGPLNPMQLEYLTHIMRSSDGLKALVNDILDLADIDAGGIELDLDVIDAGEAVSAAISGLRDRAEQAGISIDVAIAPDARVMHADAKRLRQIVFNLLKNAIGFSEPGQHVSLSLTRQDDRIQLEVADQGVGIPQEVIEKVFERFEAHAIAGKHKGAGLGLAIVRSFVELHGGTVMLQSAPGKGTKVTCSLPVAVTARQAAAAEGGGR